MTNKLSEKDKKDWQDFLNSSEKLQAKDTDKSNNQITSGKKNFINPSLILRRGDNL